MTSNYKRSFAGVCKYGGRLQYLHGSTMLVIFFYLCGIVVYFDSSGAIHSYNSGDT